MTRIRGAIIDELRSLDWVPRSVRSRAREIEAAQAKLEHELQRAPTEAELAAKLGIERGGTAVLAAGDRQLLGLRARRALDRLRLLRRPGLAARHDLRPARRRPAGVARQQRDQGPADRGDRLAARARAARRRPLLLREPHPARDRRGPRRHRVARLAAAHQGGDAVEVGICSRIDSDHAVGVALACVPHKAADRIRNVALIGHRGSGKTSLHEAMLFEAGRGQPARHRRRRHDRLRPRARRAGAPDVDRRLGRDCFEHDGRKINLIDTPGEPSFVADAVAALRVADAAVVVVNAVDGGRGPAPSGSGAAPTPRAWPGSSSSTCSTASAPTSSPPSTR